MQPIKAQSRNSCSSLQSIITTGNCFTLERSDTESTVDSMQPQTWPLAPSPVRISNGSLQRSSNSRGVKRRVSHVVTRSNNPAQSKSSETLRQLKKMISPSPSTNRLRKPPGNMFNSRSTDFVIHSAPTESSKRLHSRKDFSSLLPTSQVGRPRRYKANPGERSRSIVRSRSQMAGILCANTTPITATTLPALLSPSQTRKLHSRSGTPLPFLQVHYPPLRVVNGSESPRTSENTSTAENGNQKSKPSRKALEAEIRRLQQAHRASEQTCSDLRDLLAKEQTARATAEAKTSKRSSLLMVAQIQDLKTKQKENAVELRHLEDRDAVKGDEFALLKTEMGLMRKGLDTELATLRNEVHNLRRRATRYASSHPQRLQSTSYELDHLPVGMQASLPGSSKTRASKTLQTVLNRTQAPVSQTHKPFPCLPVELEGDAAWPTPLLEMEPMFSGFNLDFNLGLGNRSR